MLSMHKKCITSVHIIRDAKEAKLSKNNCFFVVKGGTLLYLVLLCI